MSCNPMCVGFPLFMENMQALFRYAQLFGGWTALPILFVTSCHDLQCLHDSGLFSGMAGRWSFRMRETPTIPNQAGARLEN